MASRVEFICNRCSLILSPQQLREVVTYLTAKAGPGEIALPDGKRHSGSNAVLHNLRISRYQGVILLEAEALQLCGRYQEYRYHFTSLTCGPALWLVEPTIQILKTVFRRYSGELAGHFQGERYPLEEQAPLDRQGATTWGYFVISDKEEFPPVIPRHDLVRFPVPPQFRQGGVYLWPLLERWQGEARIKNVVPFIEQTAKLGQSQVSLDGEFDIPLLFEYPDGTELAVFIQPDRWDRQQEQQFLLHLQALSRSPYAEALVLILACWPIPENVALFLSFIRGEPLIISPRLPRSRPGRTQLEEWAGSEDINRRIQVASCSYTPLALLRWLGQDQAKEVRLAVARHRFRSRSAEVGELLTSLAQDSSSLVRQAVAANPACPDDLLQQLGADPQFACALATNPSTPQGLLSHLVIHLEPDCLVTLASNPNASIELLKQLVEGDVTLVDPIAKSGALTIEFARRVHARKVPIVDAALASCRTLPQEFYIELARCGIEVLASNPAVGPEPLAWLAARSTTWYTLECIARHPQANSTTLSTIFSRCKTPQGSRFPGSEGQSPLFQHRNYIFRALAANEQTPSHVLIQLVNENDPLTLFCLAANSQTPEGCLQRLMDHEDTLVAETARWLLLRQKD